MSPSILGSFPLRWRHNERDGVSIQQPHDCLLNRLFRRRSKETSKLRDTGLCDGNSPVTAQRASNAEKASIWWRHHGIYAFWATYKPRYKRYTGYDREKRHRQPWLISLLSPGPFSHIVFNSLWHSSSIRHHRSRSTLVQVMACCLSAASRSGKQYLFVVGKTSDIFRLKFRIFVQKDAFKVASAKRRPLCTSLILLTPKQLETHGCVISTVATDALVLHHQANSIHIAGYRVIDWTSFIQI